MRIGVPKEIKIQEGRVGLIPDAVADLVDSGHEVFIESNAGSACGYSDEAYKQVGAKIAADAKALFEAGELIVKVKEPIEGDLEHLRQDHLLFCYLHLAAEPKLVEALKQIGLTAVAFETVSEEDGSLPLLAPMSDIAGRLSAQVGTHLLHRSMGGKGILMGGLPATKRGNAVVIGAGVAGTNAARLLAATGANVVVFDINRQRLEDIRELGPNVTALYPFRTVIADVVSKADLVVGAVLIPGAKAPYVVTEDMVKTMEAGSVLIDISVDQGGCVETTRPTNYEQPTYVKHGVVHFAVTNMPGTVPKMASNALSSAIIPYVQKLAKPGWQSLKSLQAGINVSRGELVLDSIL